MAAPPPSESRRPQAGHAGRPAVREFLLGVRDISGPALGTLAVGLVTGVAMAKSGLPLAVVLAAGLLVFASASQLACLPLVAAGAPLWLVVTTACVLNLRFVVFSAYWRPYFAHQPRGRRLLLGYISGDPIFAAMNQRFPLPAPGQLPYFLGLALFNWLVWQVGSLIGLFMSDDIPMDLGLRFLGMLALFALALPMLVDRATWTSAAVACAVAMLASGLPYGLNVVLALMAAVATGVWLDRRRPGAATA